MQVVQEDHNGLFGYRHRVSIKRKHEQDKDIVYDPGISAYSAVHYSGW